MSRLLKNEFKNFLDSYDGFEKPFTREQVEYFTETIRYAKDRNEFMYNVTDGGDLILEMCVTFNKVRDTYRGDEEIINSYNVIQLGIIVTQQKQEVS